MYKVSLWFSLSPKELGKCTIAKAKFPLQEQAKPVDHHPYRTNPREQEVVDKYVESMESDGIIEKSPSAWGSPVCIVAKDGGSPRFCVDYRININNFSVRGKRSMPNIECHIDTVRGAEYITVCDVQSTYWQIPIVKKDCPKTAPVTSKPNTSLKFYPSASPTHLGYFNV